MPCLKPLQKPRPPGLVRVVVSVTEVMPETPSTVTLTFPYPLPAQPGQFVMVWLPGEDEIPMSLSRTDGPLKAVTIKAMGETTRNVLSLSPGARIGIRGPYGRPFDLSPRRVLVVGGGSGTAVLAPAVEAARRGGSAVTVALGATRAEELLFRDRLSSVEGVSLHVATDDGSAGERGFVTLLADRLLASGSFDALWTCGPERMMEKLRSSARDRGVPFFASVERQMKCSLGLCDACAFGPFHVCTDGPVFSEEQLRQVPDFGRFKRDASGSRVPP
jgi:dihydroorotate dehydrogenase electron transfer subunit